MEKTGICFSKNGEKILEKINAAAGSAGIAPVTIHAFYDQSKTQDQNLQEFVAKEFASGHALLFVGAAGIAVRLIAGCIKDKLSDAPVIVIDEKARFVIPILSGHAGSANKLASTLAELLDAIPVITTATDVNAAFSADVFAVENRLQIKNREGIKKVSTKALAGKPVTLSIKDYPPKEKTDIIIADETDREYSLLLSPKSYVVGIGMKKSYDAGRCEDFLLSLLRENHMEPDEIYCLATIDLKQDEQAIRAFSDKYKIPVIAFEAALLERVTGDFHGSEFVKETTGVDNVCERAAMLAAGAGAELLVAKQKGEGITAAIALRKAPMQFAL